MYLAPRRRTGCGGRASQRRRRGCHRGVAAASPFRSLAAGRAPIRPGGRSARWLLLLSLTASGLVIGVDRGELAWNGYNAQARWLEWLAPVVNLPRAAPSFFWPGSRPGVATEVAVLRALPCVWPWSPLAVRLARGGATAAERREAVRHRRVRRRAAGPDAASSSLAGGSIARTALDPARSQTRRRSLAWRAESARSRSRPRRWRLQATRRAVCVITSRTDRRVHARAVRVGRVRDVPAGTYDARTPNRRPQRGVLGLAIGSSVGAAAGTSHPAAVASELRRCAFLPAPGGHARARPRPGGNAAAPSSCSRGVSTGSRDRSPARRCPIRRHDVFFLDGGTFVEPDGFWVGGQTARFVLQPGLGASDDAPLEWCGRECRRARRRWGRRGRSRSQGRRSTRRFRCRRDRASEWRRVTLRSRSGFRPSDQGGRRRPVSWGARSKCAESRGGAGFSPPQRAG